MHDYRYDLFICHAWEDKEGFVRPLPDILRSLGLKVWYDEFILRVGDGLLQSIDRGLAESSHGIVVLSKAFFTKEIPQHEFRGLLTRQLHEGRKVILPIWHGVNMVEVQKFSPTLADSLALRTAEMAAPDIGVAVLREVRPDIYEQYDRDDLLRLYKSKPLHELHDELLSLRADLSEFQCPHCGSLQVEHTTIGGDDFRGEVEQTTYACGLALKDSTTIVACPHDPNLPEYEEFDLHLKQTASDAWFAFGKPRTERAKWFGTLIMGSGSVPMTKEHATRLVYATYLQRVRPREWEKLSFDQQMDMLIQPDSQR